jgi:hypothetical protein
MAMTLVLPPIPRPDPGLLPLQFILTTININYEVMKFYMPISVCSLYENSDKTSDTAVRRIFNLIKE